MILFIFVYLLYEFWKELLYVKDVFLLLGIIMIGDFEVMCVISFLFLYNLVMIFDLIGSIMCLSMVMDGCVDRIEMRYIYDVSCGFILKFLS